jgi:hypothetical protein
LRRTGRPPRWESCHPACCGCLPDSPLLQNG